MDAWATKQQADHNRASFRRMTEAWPAPRRVRPKFTDEQLAIAVRSLERAEQARKKVA